MKVNSWVLVGLVHLVIATAAVGADHAPTTDSAEVKVLRFTAIPDHNATELKEKYDPVAAHLSHKLQVPVEYVPSIDYQASVEMFRNGDILLAWFGGLTGVQARRAVPGARAIVQGAEDPEYYSYFIAHKSTGLEMSEEFPEQLRDVPFSFGSESSTSGRLMPEFFIRDRTGNKPSEFFKHPYGFSGSHPKTVELVAKGSAVKAGVVNYRTYDKMAAENKIDTDICRVIWKTPYYADYNFTAHPDLDVLFGEGFIDRLQRVLIDIEAPELLDAFQRSALIKAKNEDFDGIAKIAKELGMVR